MLPTLPGRGDVVGRGSLCCWPGRGGSSELAEPLPGAGLRGMAGNRAAPRVPAEPTLNNRALSCSRQYADPVTDLLDKCGVFRARLFRESCVFHQGCYVKDLSRLGRDLHKTLILDNSPASYIFHPENAVSPSGHG